MPILTPQQVASAIVASIEKGSRTIVAPAAFRLLFLLNSLFPAQTEASMCKVS
jgi:short-subunit dehydrogenase